MMNEQQEKLIKDNISFARWLAHRWDKTQSLLDYDELESMAFFGLTKAAQSYNPNKGTQFNTYARFVIENQFRNAYKKEKKYTIKVDSEIENNSLVNFDMSESLDLKTVLEKYLTQEQKKILLQAYEQGLSQREIANLRGMSQTKVNSIIKQAKLKIAEYIR